jgi:hypothetical protein
MTKEEALALALVTYAEGKTLEDIDEPDRSEVRLRLAEITEDMGAVYTPPEE